jgi:phage N-6-adenine-methyltransferase
MFSSSSDEWETPWEFFSALDAVFHFTLDVCASHANAKCGRYFTKADDGLSQMWSGVCWRKGPAPVPSVLVVFGCSGIADIGKTGFNKTELATDSQAI